MAETEAARDTVRAELAELQKKARHIQFKVSAVYFGAHSSFPFFTHLYLYYMNYSKDWPSLLPRALSRKMPYILFETMDNQNLY